jgi:F0F1-type ATP synthase assembly protein I
MSATRAGNRILVGMAGKKDKAADKASKATRRAERKAKRGQIFEAFKMQRREDKALVPIMAGVIIGAAAVAYVVGLFLDLQWTLLPLGVVLGVLLAVIIFGRRVQRTVYTKADGQPGAAAWALDNMRGRWTVTQAVAGTTQLDALHRVLGRPGIILVGEGAPHRVKALLAQEKKRVARVVGDTPIYDVIVGNDEGQIPLRRLQQHIMKLPKNISPSQIDSMETRLAALASRGAAMPKGPLPQGAKVRNVQRAMRRR